ncbi:MAG: DNA-3-methyladenine glycosylase [Patescibacteria group bacterium]|nr:DNA-3-methyladenine glycosylase [Patescibacteria group bacterium]
MDQKAIKHLSKDKVMARLIRECSLREWPRVNYAPQFLFSEILETILGQQLSNKAADTIIGRFKGIFGGKHPTPEQLLKVKDQTIRNCGTSWSKVSYVKNVARAVKSKELDLRKIQSLSDEEVKAELLKIKGVGNWTAEMVLMFTLRRPDIFSSGDMGLQNAMHRHYKVRKGDIKKMEKIAEGWKPYRSLACRYLWKSLDG